ncbi:MAG: asparagine synthase (glutamine-hydrolyzing) [Myxococcota bacterium]
MCGIALLASKTPVPAEALRIPILRMTQAQAHRGPDRSAIWLGGSVVAGHNRLRVVDLQPRADQPFFHRGVPSAPVLVYNGEIYNYRSLRAQLASDGVAFRTGSDTEVLYQLLRHEGPSGISKLEGMFGFAFYDPTAACILLARDRIGIKPLIYADTDRGLVVASELSGVLASGWVDPSLDPHAVHQVARFNHLLGEATAVPGVRSLSPGTTLEIDLRTWTLRRNRYFRLSLAPDGALHHERREHLEREFRRAVRSHLQSDIPVASFMSGGIDSTALAIEANRVSRGKLQTFSLLFPGQHFDEGEHIRAIRRASRIRNEEVPMRQTSFAEYRRYIERAAMPQLWTTDLALARLSETAAAHGHRAVLSGEGPDELFAGYDSFRWMALRRWFDRFRLSRALCHLPKSRLRWRGITWFDIEVSMVRYYARAHRDAQAQRADLTYGFHPENLPTWDFLDGSPVFASDFRARFPRYRAEQAESIRAVLSTSKNQSALQKNLQFELEIRLPNWVLAMADRMSAAHGVELRVPYLADGFVAAALSLDDRDRLRGMNEKYIFKQLHRHRVPEFVRRRHKQALYTPITEWVGTFFGDEDFEEQWSGGRFADAGLFDQEEAREVRERVRSGNYSSLLEQLQSEWMFLLITSSHLLHESIARVPRSEPSPISIATGA